MKEDNQQSENTQNQSTPVQAQPIISGSPDVSPQTQSVKKQTIPNSKNKKSKKRLILGLVLTIFVLVAGGAAAYFVHQNNRPEKVLADALVNTMSDLVEKKPASSMGALTFEVSGDNPLKLSVQFEGANSGDDGKGSADITVNFGGNTYTIKTSAITFSDQEYYVKIENLAETIKTLTGNQPEFANYSETFEPIISKIDNRWIKITQDDLQEFGVADKETIDACSTALQNVNLSGDDKKQLKKLFKENQFIIAGETFSNETVADENSFHYKLDFNNQAAQNFAKEVITMQSFEQVRNDCDLNEQKIEEGFEQNNSTEREDELEPVIELWVGKKSRRPTKVRLSGNNKEVTVDFNTEIKLDAQDVSIEKPENSVSVKELRSDFENLFQQ